MAEQTAKEYRAVQREHLVREMETHKGGIKYAEGQVQELKELIEQIDNACLYCGRAIRNWRDETPSQMERHIADRHPEEVIPALPVDYMGEEREGESGVVHA